MQEMTMHIGSDEPMPITLRLKPSLLQQVELLRVEWGLSSRAAVIERLLDEVFEPESPRLQ